MTPKPHRTLRDRVSGYADEAAAYLRRRRQMRRPFARVYRTDGRCVAVPRESSEGERIFSAAAALIEIAGPPRRPGALSSRPRR